MIQDGHTEKKSIGVTAPVGDTSVVSAVDGAWIYIHELIGDLSAGGTLTVKAGATVLGEFNLDAGQGITIQDTDGDSNLPKYKIKPGDDFVVTTTGGDFQGACTYSLKY